MEFEFDDKELVKLYTTGQSRKLRLTEQIIDKFLATIQKIDAAVTIKDLLADNGLRFKKMKNSQNQYSMRLTDKYRLECEISWIDGKQTIGKFLITAISNHYGD